MYNLELLSRAHDREGFDCGTQPLNVFFRQTARQHAERGISRTFADAKDEAAKAYYERYGFVPLPDNALQLFLPLQTLRKALEDPS